MEAVREDILDFAYFVERGVAVVIHDESFSGEGVLNGKLGGESSTSWDAWAAWGVHSFLSSACGKSYVIKVVFKDFVLSNHIP